MTAEFTGRHVLAEFGGVDGTLCDDLDRLTAALHAALTTAGVTICEMVSKQFEPHGVTVLALLAESHASLHTYPESGDIFVDVFTCGTSADSAEAVAEYLRAALSPRRVQISTVRRGRAPVRDRDGAGGIGG
ncbi:adenosylmethionine decarboxylase [Nocardia flavorosea]|uniref:Adenosylmethionine decarboxylase n=1 Tax=Nocardia flavorosea TaxID=53429 RepID=A0A846YL62_9NOCA|nr:adenosylmethionine decarboxylase [Nocardia flavorosea]NKY59725.1 adenosylmethionine decarboxylase [Nocardia flavorosea]